jgi:cytoskeletal protein CcmA (bactofilin family)
MWNKRKEEEYPPKPASAPASSANVQRETHAPMTTAPAASFHMPERGTAVIGKSVIVKGQIFSREDLTVDGEVEGSIELQENRLTIGPHGKLRAGVKAREIVILGTVNGNVEAGDKIDIRKDAKLVGDLKTSRIVIEDGAYFKGSIDIIKPEAKPAPAPAPQPPKAAPAPQPAPAVSAAAPGSSAGTPVTSAAESKR